jgi:predicted nucleotidyltransferase
MLSESNARVIHGGRTGVCRTFTVSYEPDQLHHLPYSQRGWERVDLREMSIPVLGGRLDPNILKPNVGRVPHGLPKSKIMKPSHAIQGKTSEIKLLIVSNGFVSPTIFGSTVRGTDVDGSDLDILATILADLRGKISLLDIQHLEEALEALTGVAVDFNVKNAMPDHLRPSIVREMVML